MTDLTNLFKKTILYREYPEAAQLVTRLHELSEQQDAQGTGISSLNDQNVQKRDFSMYKDKMIAEGQGEAQRFTSVVQAYQAAPDISRRRLYLETLEDVLKNSNKIIIDKGVGNFLPYLPLNTGGQARAAITPPPGSSEPADTDVASVERQALPTLSPSDMGGQ